LLDTPVEPAGIRNSACNDEDVANVARLDVPGLVVPPANALEANALEANALEANALEANALEMIIPLFVTQPYITDQKRARSRPEERAMGFRRRPSAFG